MKPKLVWMARWGLILTAVLLFATPSQASAFTLFVDNVAPPGVDYTTQGAMTNTGASFLNFLNPTEGGFGQAYGSPSAISFGSLVTASFGSAPPNASGYFNATVNFTFTLENGNHQDDSEPTEAYAQFVVTGTVVGNVGDSAGAGFSTAQFTVTSVQNLSATAGQTRYAVLAPSPNNGLAAYYLQAQVGGTVYNVYVTQTTEIPPPGGVSFTLMGFVAVAPLTPTITGSIALEAVPNLAGISPAAPLGAFHISFRQPGTRNEIYSQDVSLTPTQGGSKGGYSIRGLGDGVYDALIKGSKNLAVLIKNVVISGASGTIADVTLPAGDANNDNSIDTTDFGLLVGSYGSDSNVSGSGYNPTCDFNFDGIVDTTDFSILVGEYSNVGDD